MNGLTNSDEVLNIDGVRDVGVEVVFEVLEHIHVGLDELVSSNSWEGEGRVIKFPSLNSWGGELKLTSDLHGVFIVLDIELS